MNDSEVLGYKQHPSNPLVPRTSWEEASRKLLQWRATSAMTQMIYNEVFMGVMAGSMVPSEFTVLNGARDS